MVISGSAAWDDPMHFLALSHVVFMPVLLEVAKVANAKVSRVTVDIT